ncbi:hypothetical protein FUAX_46090 (plasmid) [Fulvitalea axinellae]|uniref:Uncharacterized protein n=1 Tax=Fulvitalea axinellae TaxID=1182444 RepID=A0AAU9CW82_9BACT|nr:hypothetical protein FUAX_46090 [Fulvitalea axinellae]
MPIKNAIEALNKAVEDLTSLHVQTFTGTLDSSSLTGKEPFNNIRDLVKNQSTSTNAKLTLVAESLTQFDGDSYNFVNKDIDAAPPIVLEVHKNAVKSGIETRIALLNLFKDVIK